MGLVLVAVDGSKHADRALQWYLDHVHSSTNTVILCHVQEPIAIAGFAFSASELQWATIIKEREDKEQELIRKYREILEEKGIKYKVHRSAGAPGHLICQAAKDDKVDLVVVGSRGHGVMRRTILGSISDYVLHHAVCPVVVCSH